MMSAESKRWVVSLLGCLFLASLVVVAYREVATVRRPGERPKPVVSAESRECVDCHRQETPAIVKQWEDSKHAARGIGCLACHKASPKDVDGHDHMGGFIATIVTPKDCSQCHAQEFKEQSASRHAAAAAFDGAPGLLLAGIAAGTTSEELGCRGCHGSVVRVLSDGTLDPATWPNAGIGRVNPDGSKGSCSSCHFRHDFLLNNARAAEACRQCHNGHDHPQLEILGAARRGIAEWLRSGVNPEPPTGVVARGDYSTPTCATCHMSGSETQPMTHDPGARLSWTLRSIPAGHPQDWKSRRARMGDVCSACHSDSWITAYYVQLDQVRARYDEKLAKPALKIMQNLYASKALGPAPLDEPIELTFFELWHHEGRYSRRGASMMGTDFAEWRGAYEAARQFYVALRVEASRLGARRLTPE